MEGLHIKLFATIFSVNTLVLCTDNVGVDVLYRKNDPDLEVHFVQQLPVMPNMKKGREKECFIGYKILLDEASYYHEGMPFDDAEGRHRCSLSTVRYYHNNIIHFQNEDFTVNVNKRLKYCTCQYRRMDQRFAADFALLRSFPRNIEGTEIKTYFLLKEVRTLNSEPPVDADFVDRYIHYLTSHSEMSMLKYEIVSFYAYTD